MSDTIRLSKSTYCGAFQCPKILWLQRNKPEVKVETSDPAVLENGTRVGDYARSYFGSYALVDYTTDNKKMVEQTLAYIEAGEENIAEASFIYDDLYCAVDILHKNGDGWDIVEVKSSTSVHDIYVEDVSYQYYILKKCGINVKKAFIMYVNTGYVRHGELDIKQLFTCEDLTDEAVKRFDILPDRIKEIRDYVSVPDEPEKAIGMHCYDPYECAFREYCWRDIPTPSVFNISGLFKKKMFGLYDQGLITFDDLVREKAELSEKEKMQVEWEVKDLPDHIDKEGIKEFLDQLRYPLYHLDFETFQQAIPEFEGGVPYRQIPFQYSLHIEYEDGRLDHKEFLAKEGTDPRRKVAERLCDDIPLGVCSLAYNFGFEKRTIRELAELYPDLSDHLMDIHDHMVDLMTPFQKGYYYSKAMQGRYTIKYVLPALYPDDPELDYHNLDQVHNGDEASAAFFTMADKSPEEIESLRSNLLKYCGLDTYAMVKVLGKLREALDK